MSIFSLLFMSCIGDTDFEQAEDIALTPIVESNIIFLNVEGREFFDSTINQPRLILRDTTEIKFLDDSGFQESLKKVDFLFKYKNTIPKPIAVTYRFLSELNDTTYTVQNTVEAGTLQNAATSENTEIIEGNNVLDLTRANKVVVILSIPSADQNLLGNFNLQSKATFYFEL